GYFAALRIPLRAGRGLTDVDLQSGARVALVNQAFVRQMWPEGEPLGRQIVLTSDAKPVEVVGVVGDVRHLGLDLPPRPEVYLPEGLEPWPFAGGATWRASCGPRSRPATAISPSPGWRAWSSAWLT